MMYFHVTQDAGAVILFDRTPKKIQFLVTNGIESCTPIMAKGTHGIAMVHDSGRLTDESIGKIFKMIGDIEFWTTACYPKSDKNYRKLNPKAYQEQFGEQGIYATNFARISKIMESIVKPGSKGYLPKDSYHAVTKKDRMVAFDREGNVYTQPEQCVASPVVQPDLELRVVINSLRMINYPFDCDLQYDGEKISSHPVLPVPIAGIRAVFASEKLILELCDDYEKHQKDYAALLNRVKTVVSKYKADSAGHALRCAASQGKDDDVKFLAGEVGVDVNEQGAKTGKTALHFAASNGHITTFAILKCLGAEDDIQDVKHVTAASIIEQKLKGMNDF